MIKKRPEKIALPLNWTGVLMLADGSGLTARVGTTAGSGNAVICTISNDGSISNIGGTFKVFNPFDVAVDANTYITVKVINGTQLVVDELVESVDGGTNPPDPPPSGDIDCAAFAAYLDGRCCEHSATDRCNYKCEAIKSLSLDDGAGHISMPMLRVRD